MSIVQIPEQGEIEGVSIPLRPFSDDAGCKESTATAYIGIPYAQPPIESLRWKRPQTPAPSWQGLRHSAWQCDPIQELSRTEFFWKPRRRKLLASEDAEEEGKSRISEDCLYLNIWVPSGEHSKPLPVIVWIYGGAFITGAASIPIYDGARLANESKCIVVSISYRVGLFGWLGSRELAREDEGTGCGNYGAWDVVAGLQWLHKNIDHFNGDAENMSLFGESAGSILIHYLTLSEKVPENLFARAILNSGTALTKPARSIASAQATFDALVERVGGRMDISDEDKLTLLRNASTEELFDSAKKLPASMPRTEYRVDEEKRRPANRFDADPNDIEMEAQNVFGPVWDGIFVDEDFLTTAKKGLPSNLNNAKKGIMLSYNVDEGTMFALMLQSAKALQHHINGFNPGLVASLKELYGIDSMQSSENALAMASAMAGDEYFQVPIRELMLTLANQQKIPSYGCIFAHRPSPQQLESLYQSKEIASLAQKLGAGHTVELPFYFGNDGTHSHIFARQDYPIDGDLAEDSARAGFTTEERIVSLSCMRSLGAFAHGKSPWKALNDDSAKVDTIGDLFVRSYGDAASIKSPYDRYSTISIQDIHVSKHPHWKEESLPSVESRQAFWGGSNFKNLLISFYGDERMQFES